MKGMSAFAWGVAAVVVGLFVFGFVKEKWPMGGIVSDAIASMFILILLFLIVTNYKGFTAVMKQGGTSTVSLVKALQGR